MASANFDKGTDSLRGHVCAQKKRSSKSVFTSKKKALSWAYETKQKLKKELESLLTKENAPSYIADNSYILGIKANQIQKGSFTEEKRRKYRDKKSTFY